MRGSYTIIVRVLAFIFCLANCAISVGATFYLAPTGKDTNPGTSWNAAWATLSKCQSTLASGDTVLIKNGLYGNFSKTAGAYTNWVTYKAAEGNNAVRFGNLYLSHSSGVNYYHRFEGIVFDKTDYSGSPPDYYLSIKGKPRLTQRRLPSNPDQTEEAVPPGRRRLDSVRG